MREILIQIQWGVSVAYEFKGVTEAVCLEESVFDRRRFNSLVVSVEICRNRLSYLPFLGVGTEVHWVFMCAGMGTPTKAYCQSAIYYSYYLLFTPPFLPFSNFNIPFSVHWHMYSTYPFLAFGILLRCYIQKNTLQITM